MNLDTFFHDLCWIILVAAVTLSGAKAQKSGCSKSEFWNSDGDLCVPCSTCKQYPKTPYCETCSPVEAPDSWRVAAITSFSILATLIVFGALLIGVLIHQYRSRRRPLREPIEETTGPRYAV